VKEEGIHHLEILSRKSTIFGTNSLIYKLFLFVLICLAVLFVSLVNFSLQKSNLILATKLILLILRLNNSAFNIQNK